jgi:uncharacterized SAM-binding protein YcdF (DUF218 family)
MLNDHPKSKRWRGWSLLIAVMFSLTAALAAFHSLGFFLQAPAASPGFADVIVPLGGDPGSRIIEAGRLYSTGAAPAVILTGNKRGYEASAANYRIQVLLQAGVPTKSIFFEDKATSSWEEAIGVRRLMEDHGWTRVLVVSDPPHMRRLDFTWSRVFSGTQMQYRLVAAPVEWWDASHWWRNRLATTYAFRECVKLLYYYLAK